LKEKRCLAERREKKQRCPSIRERRNYMPKGIRRESAKE